MKKTILLFLFNFSFLIFNFSQVYRSAANSYYWKNRKPFEGYWQQDVHYKIFAKVDEKTDIVSGNEELTYYNNSPDTLRFVYFHLYQNAFQPGSYFDKMTKENGVKPKYGHYEAQGKNEVIENLFVGSEPAKMELDNTILKVYLPEPLLPNDSDKFQIVFKSYFDSGTQRRRMKMFNSFPNKHYDGVHWYPRLCVYDRKFGWETDQHMEKEFYGDFGTYDVEVNFANNYIVEATGDLLNRSEVLPDELRKKLDISNFKSKPMFSAPSVIIPYDSTEKSRKTWKYHAINVHDFAFTADPTYRIGESEWNGIKCIALAQEGVAARWQNAADYTAKIIKTYSEDFGMYAYPKMVVADARDGMEYPMLTLDGGWDPNYRDLFTHEVGHNWFFGMVGTNETYRAFMDEGFTQFLTCWSYEKIDGQKRIQTPSASKYVERFSNTDYVRNSEVYLPYMIDAIHGEETNISRHSNDFNTALRHGGGYRQVYFKTAVMLYNLQYVLGDELFLKAMQHYVSQWKIAHPYPEDFRNSIIQFTHVDLNWFFDEWLETSKTIDYEIESVKQTKNPGEYKITFEREGQLQMPIDFVVIAKNDSVHKFHIPNTWFVKKTDATVLPKWYGWDKIQPTYEAVVKIPSGIKQVIIDPSERLADVDMRNNKFPMEVSYNFDSKINNPPDWTQYEVFTRPDVWYNSFDGVKAGIHINGNFMNYYDAFDANFWINSGLAQGKVDSTISRNAFNNVSYRLNYKTSTDKFVKNSSVNISIKHLDGLNAYSAGFEKRDKNNLNRVYGFFKSMIRQRYEDRAYLLFPDEWDNGMLNNTINLGYEHNYNYSWGTGKINLDLRSSTLMSDYDYANAHLTVVNKNRLGKKLNWNTRFFVQYGTGKNSPKESALYLAGANPEELMENKFTRSRGFFPDEWMGYGANVNHFQMGGGLNLRGYAGYLAPQEDANGNIKFVYRGNSGAAFNTELEFDQLFKFIHITDQNGIIKWAQKTFKLNTYLFGDVGVLNYNSSSENLKLADFRADAGAGAALTIKKWGPLQKVDPLTIRFDSPFFLNRIPAVETNYTAFRWMIGVSRTF
ncbi:MAG: M1 family metallopeptidase [Bacteroidetes bacterium]|nr:M1 family metallopeptidase [Bacteroidota bacterium]